MESLKIGDLVVRKSHSGDVIFKVVALTAKSALLRGVECRLMADAPLDDIVPCPGLRPVTPGKASNRPVGRPKAAQL